MLITFKSKAAAEILMYQEHAQPLFDLLGKDARRGVLTAEELPGAVASLEAEIAARRKREEEARQRAIEARRASHDDGDDPDNIKGLPVVSFGTRLFPLLDMMRAAARKKTEVMWGV